MSVTQTSGARRLCMGCGEGLTGRVQAHLRALGKVEPSRQPSRIPPASTEDRR